MEGISLKTQKSVIIFLSLVAVICLILLGIFLQDDNHVGVHILDVGQGNAALIQTPNDITVLIDGGPDNSILSALGEYMPFHDRTIEVVLITHPHFDHINGLLAVFERYEIGNVYLSGVNYSSLTYERLRDSLQSQNTIIIDSPRHITLQDFGRLEIVFPDSSFEGNDVDNVNNTSLVTRYTWNDFEILFPGDIEREIESYIVTQAYDIHSDILISPHQGSKTSSTEDFLQLIDPEHIIISVGADNDYGHPHREVLERYRQLKMPYTRTDIAGTVSIETDGEGYTLQ